MGTEQESPLLKALFDETLKALEGIKSGTEQTMKKCAEEANIRIEAIVKEARDRCEEIRKSMDK